MAFLPCNNVGGGSGLKATVLWTNSDPTQNFAGQAVTLSDNITNYQFYEVIGISQTNLPGIAQTSGLIPIDKGCQLQKTGGQNSNRDVVAPSGTTITFGNGYSYPTYSGSGSVNNGQLVPIKVIGFK